jgi:serine/threonine-protein kinase
MSPPQGRDSVPDAPAPASPPPVPELRTDPLVGSVLADRYEILRRIGEGGMGAVYEARHTVIGKRVAVKVLLEKFLEKPELVARLLQEARLASSIGHENIVDVTDFGTTADGRGFVVMEFLEGESLAQLVIRDAPLPVERSLRIARQVASALGAAHDKGIVHRDVKPENVYLVRRADADYVKVVDFGVSKAVHTREEGPEWQRLTRTGMVLGTPLYMSPEQARGGEDIDARADIWAVGVLLYECLTG